LVNRIRAKSALNEGAKAYRSGDYAVAEQKFRESYELDPSQKNAPTLIARAVMQQFKPGVEKPENVARAQAALDEYQKILTNDPNNEEAFNAIVYLYRQTKNDAKEREWLVQRASLDSVPKEKRAVANIILASKQWDCAYDITEANKKTDPIKATIKYEKPANQPDFEKALGCVREGLKLAEQAISLDPANANAWSQKANLLREMSKLSEMDGNAAQKEQYEKQFQEALAKHTQLSEEAKKKKEADDAAKGQQPPAS
jgi:tetratricopeptide (TPR) repeat protein